MPTVIDSLIVELGLDPKGFDSGRKKAAADFLKTRDDADKVAKEIEAAGKRAAQFFSQLRSQVVGMFAAFTAGRGLKDFVADVVEADAATGRLAKALSTSVQVLSALRGAAIIAGGSAAATAGSIGNLVRQFQQFSITGQSEVVPYFRALGISLSDAQGRMRGVDDILLDLADSFSKMDPAKASAFGAAMGLDAGTINLLLQGREGVRAMIDEQKRLGVVTPEMTQAAQQMQRAWREMSQASESLGRTLLTELAPVIVRVLNALTDLAVWAREHKPLIEAAFASLTAAAVALAVAFSPISLATAAIIAGLVALGAGLSLLYDDFVTWVNGGKSLLGPFFDWMLDKFERVERAVKAVGGFFGKIWDKSAKPAAAAPLGSASPSSVRRGDVETLMGHGWTQAQAIGIAANLQRESGGDINAIGDNGNARGLAQWHPDRQAAFEKWAGHSLASSSRDEQLAFVSYELQQGSERRAGAALRATSSAGAAASVVSRLYERPANVSGEANVRSRLAEAMANSYAPPGTALAAGGSSTSTSTSHQTSIGSVNVYTNATDPDGIARDLKSSLARDSFATQANYGPG